jgi:hypothetical protein
MLKSRALPLHPLWAFVAFYYKSTVCNSFGIWVGQYVSKSVGNKKFSRKINGKRENKSMVFNVGTV